jgi:hypothetical protein
MTKYRCRKKDYKNISMKILKIPSFFLLLAVLFFSCQKEYSLEGVITSAGTWQFNDDNKLYAGGIDTAYIETAGTTKTLNLIGKSSDGNQNFLLHLYATDSFTVGAYKASLFKSDFQYYTQAKNIYQADQFIGEFIVTISAISNNSITGIFSGAAEDSTSAVKSLTLGKFTSRINLTGNGTGGGGGGGGTALGTLGASAGVCTPVTTAGTFTQGVTLTSTNTATVQVTVTTIGAYIISTNTVNGVSFSKAGTFTATGVQAVILTGTGTPTNSGVQNFTVTFGTSTCNFSLTFLPGTTSTDYFPITPGSNWAYGLKGGTPADSLLIKVIPYQLTVGANTYSTFTVDDNPASGTPDSLYFRKPGGDYYEYFNTQEFFGFDGPGTPANVEYIFLKDNVPQGTTWNSPTIMGIYQGRSYTIFFKMTLFEKATTPTTSGAVTSSDVLKVKIEYVTSTAPTTPFYTEERWFAKSIGLIYTRFDDRLNNNIYNVGRYQVF